MGNKDKDKEQTSKRALGNSTQSPQGACQANRDLSHEREAALNWQIAEAITRETAKVTACFEAILNERNALNFAGSLKVTSRAAGFKVMDSFD